jgi:hypothetical protein
MKLRDVTKVIVCSVAVLFGVWSIMYGCQGVIIDTGRAIAKP